MRKRTARSDFFSGDAGEGDNAKLSKEYRRRRYEGAERKARNRLAQEVRERNAYAHSLVEELQRINLGESDKLDVDLKRIKTAALQQLIVKNVISDRRLACKLPNAWHYFVSGRALGRLFNGLIDENIWMASVSDQELIQLAQVTDTLEMVVVKAGRKKAASAFAGYTHCARLDF